MPLIALDLFQEKKCCWFTEPQFPVADGCSIITKLSQVYFFALVLYQLVSSETLVHLSRWFSNVTACMFGVGEVNRRLDHQSIEFFQRVIDKRLTRANIDNH